MPNINLRLTDLEHAELREWAHGSRRSLQREIVFRLFDGALVGGAASAGGASVARAAAAREVSGGAGSTPVPSTASPTSAPSVVPPVVHDGVMRPHFRKDRPALQCDGRVAAGEVCSVCGTVG